MTRTIRILVAKLGLDTHDRGALVVVHALKNAGMEVIYTGFRQKTSTVVQTALQEDVDVIGVSSMNGAHMTVVPDLMNALKKENASDISVVVGGIIPPQDADELKKLGVKEVFGPGTSTSDIVEFIKTSMAD